MQSMKERLIIALDVDTAKEAMELVRLLGSHVGMFKVGLQLFTAMGPGIIEMIHAHGSRIFLDLKLHDIPNTVARTCRVLTGYGVDMFNVHASGGFAMMQKAREAVFEEAEKKGIIKPALIAVTVLTSLDRDELAEAGFAGTPEETAVKLALLAQRAGLDGVVSSPRETGLIRDACGSKFLIVTPGVRPAFSESGDQKRTATPREAVAAGSSCLVIGRPVTAAADPLEAVEKIIAEMEDGLC